MGFTVGRRDSLQSEINVTPLVDVVLVLLILFLVIVPLTLHGYDMDMPGQAVAEASSDPEPQVVLAVGEDCPLEAQLATGLPAACRVRVNEELVPVGDLSRRMSEIYASRPAEQRVLFLAADDRLNYEGVMRVVDEARASVPDLRIALLDSQ